jgi:spermidine synthase
MPFVLIFAASGAAALVYEVTWTRLLTLQVGHSVAAASTVLAAFMGGLAIGSLTGGRVSSRFDPAAALRVYAGLEVSIAVLAILLPFEVRAINPLLSIAYANGDGGAPFAALRFATSLMLVAVPAIAMGATFPIASRWFVQDADRAAGDAGVLYAANTVGAAVGAFVAGFVLLPQLGLSGSTWVGVGLNSIAAAGAWWIASRPRAERTKTEPEVRTTRKTRRARSSTPPAAPAVRPQLALAAVALGISGFASLSMQIVWTRLLALIFGPTTYAFSIVVAVFIAALAIGAAVASRIVARLHQPAAALAICLALSVGGSAVATTMIDRGLLTVADAVAQPNATLNTVLLRQLTVAVALLAPMALAFGAAFPFAVALGVRSDATVSKDLGWIYGINTIGAIAGALATGFVLIPLLGLHGAIRTVTMLTAVGSIAVAVAGGIRHRARVLSVAAALGALALGMWLPQWDRLLLSSGGYKYAAALRGPDLETALTAGRLLYYREGASGTVAVRKVAGATSVAIDGKVDASNAGDMLTQRLLAHVPLLLHPDPRRVAILGLGSGVTLGSALTHPIERADVLEISPEMVEASRFFDAENHRAILDPRTRLLVVDGRTHLLLGDQQYDVIVSEPSNPWMAGIASLFTREFFQGARDRLAPGGIVCQWAHTYDISTADLKSIVATFVSVFPTSTMWLVGDGDVLLVGSTASLNLAQIATSWNRPGVREDLATVAALEPFHVLSQVIAEGPALMEWSAGAVIQSDDHSQLEFSGPRSIFGGRREDNATLLRQFAARLSPPAVVTAAVSSATPVAWRDRGWMLLQADAYRPAYQDFTRAVQADPNDTRALDGLLRSAAPLNLQSAARVVLERLAADPTHIAAKLALSRVLAGLGDFDGAVRIPFALLQTNPSNVAALEQLASVLSDAGDAERMEPVVARLGAEAPAAVATHYYTASLLFLQGRLELALKEAQAAIALSPRHAKAQNLAGACLASLGRHDQARSAFEASIAADPRDPATYANLATLELQTGNRERAAQYFAEALTIDPNSETARRGLAELNQ